MINRLNSLAALNEENTVTNTYHMQTIEHNRPTIPMPKSSGSFQGWGPRLAGS